MAQSSVNNGLKHRRQATRFENIAEFGRCTKGKHCKPAGERGEPNQAVQVNDKK
jgi:hypothetical protein